MLLNKLHYTCLTFSADCHVQGPRLLSIHFIPKVDISGQQKSWKTAYFSHKTGG